MTIKKVIRLFKKHTPKTVKEVKKLGLKVKKIGDGAYREVYQIEGLEIVAKFKTTKARTIYNQKERDAEYENSEHMLDEIATYNRINKHDKYKKFRKYVSKIYWYDTTNCVILEKKYTHLTSKTIKRSFEWMIDDIEKLAEKLFPNSALDLHWANYGIDTFRGKQRLVVIDLGLFNEN